MAPGDPRLWCVVVIYSPSRSTTIIMSIIATVFTAFGGLMAVDIYRFERDCVRTPGRVHAHETLRAQDKYKRPVEHAVDVYEFTTQSGDRAHYKLVRYGRGHHPIGETDTICYPEGAPDKARVAGELLGATTVMFGFGAISAVTAWMSAKGIGRAAPVQGFSQKNRAKRERKRRRRG